MINPNSRGDKDFTAKLLSEKNQFGLTKKSLNELSPADFITFVYKAESPGVNKKTHGIDAKIYDATPFIYLLDVKRSKNNILLTGLNSNYLNFAREKARVLVSIRLNGRMNRKFYQQCIHSYRLDRIQSSLYRAVDLVADAYLLKLSANFRDVESKYLV